MKKRLLLAALLCTQIALRAQYYLPIENSSFGVLETRPCPFDSTVQITQPQSWWVYQTLDGHWDGVYDSTRCLSLSTNNWNYYAKLPLASINPAEPVFVRYMSDKLDPNFKMFPNDVYSVQFNCNLIGHCNTMQTGSNCMPDICSGGYIGISIPDENGSDFSAIRWQNALFDDFGTCSFQAYSCFPTEYFENQSLGELIFKFSFDSLADYSTDTLLLQYVEINGAEPFFVSSFTDVPAESFTWNGSAYDVPLNFVIQNGWGASVIMLYDPALGYPGPDNQTFVEAHPVPNSTEQQTINLIVEPWETLEIQPYTNLRGALVEGSDSVRHIANLVNMGGELCLNFIDVIFSNSNEYLHAAGRVSMNHPRSCMQFRDHSALHLSEGAALHYGNDGNGMLVMCAGTGIKLDKNASLSIDALFMMSDCGHLGQHVMVDLLPGSKLEFTGTAVFSNLFSQNQETKLMVRMLGGSINDSNLSEEERNLIVRLYPPVPADFGQNISIYPNPFSEATQLHYTAAGPETIIVEWVDLSGRRVFTETFGAQRGLNEWPMNGPAEKGSYVVIVRSEKGQALRKLVRI